MSLSEMPVNETFRVSRILLDREVGKRLSEMGFVEGTEGRLLRRGPFNGTIQVRILGYDVLIRKSEAAAINVARRTY